MVPIVPADVRETVTGPLRDYHILWEVEQWHDQPLVTPPTDPYLIRHIGGSLWSVEAEWDLTDLEKAVIAGTRREKQ